MTISLQDFASGDTNYVAKFNSNNEVLEAAIAALQAATSGAAFSALTIANAYEALFGTGVAVIGDDSYVCTDAGSDNLNVAAGYCYRPSLSSVLSKLTSTTLNFTGQSADTYYIVIDSTGAPTSGTTSTEAVYSVVWTGSAFGAITRLATIVWGAADWIASQTSTALSSSYTSLDDRLEAIETAASLGTTAQAPYKVYAGPAGGSPTNDRPTFRSLVPGDLPTFVGDTGGSPNSSLQGAVPVANQGDAAAAKFLKADGTWAVPAGAATGTVTSVALTMPAEFSVSGSPVTSSGTLAVSRVAQDSNKVLAGPTAGSPTTAAPTFRSLVYADLPTGIIGKPRVDAHTYSAGSPTFNVTFDCASYDLFEITLTGDITIGFSGATDGQRIAVRVTQDGTGSRLITWSSDVSFGTDITSATATTTASKVDYFGLVYNSTAAKYHMVAVARGY